jgi:uncharacterized protein (DUF2141 family)
MKATKTTIVAAAALLASGAGGSGIGAGGGGGGARADTLGDISLEVVGLRSDGGEVLAALFNSPEGFPDGRYAFRYAKIVPQGRVARTTFPRVPSGEYAIAIIHDEDRDGRLGTNFLGIPTEGYGASRNNLPRFSAPKWKGNRFALGAGEVKQVQIRVRY